MVGLARLYGLAYHKLDIHCVIISGSIRTLKSACTDGMRSVISAIKAVIPSNIFLEK